MTLGIFTLGTFLFRYICGGQHSFMNSQLRLLVGCVLMFCASSPPGGFWARIPHGR